MHFQFYLPSKALQSYVKGYLEADSRDSIQKTSHTLFPNGYSGIFFNFGTLGGLAIKEAYQTPAISIFGQIDQCFEAIHLPGSYSLGVLLHPTALSKFLREDMSSFTNKAFDGSLIYGDLKSLHARLEEMATTWERVETLNQYFARKFSDQYATTTVADAALQWILQPVAHPIRQLSKELNFSERYIELRFKESVGLSPKTYSLIVRFKRIEQQLRTKGTPHWKQLDFGHEYYDQNHFIKDFKRFTGHTPSEYLIKNLEMGRSYLVR